LLPGKVESRMPSFKTFSGLLLLKTGVRSSCPGKGRTSWAMEISGAGAVVARRKIGIMG
jgi:hypothetical protein